MGTIRKHISGGILGIVGFLLSPLSWWNDLLVNVPLAIAFGWAAAWFYPPCFKVAVVIGYWLTNILGLWMMQKGAQQVLAKESRPYTFRGLAKDLSIASGYTVLILVLLKYDVIQAPQGLFPSQ